MILGIGNGDKWEEVVRNGKLGRTLPVLIDSEVRNGREMGRHALGDRLGKGDRKLGGVLGRREGVIVDGR